MWDLAFIHVFHSHFPRLGRTDLHLLQFSTSLSVSFVIMMRFQSLARQVQKMATIPVFAKTDVILIVFRFFCLTYLYLFRLFSVFAFITYNIAKMCQCPVGIGCQKTNVHQGSFTSSCDILFLVYIDHEHCFNLFFRLSKRCWRHRSLPSKRR